MRTHVDLMETLGQIVAENTRYFQSDFDMDLRRLTWAAMEPKREDRCFYWMSRPLGTWCVLEREVFLRGTDAHQIWTYYQNEAAGIRACRVEVTGVEDGRLLGNVQPFSYRRQVQRLQQAALPTAAVEVTFSSGFACQVQCGEVKRSLPVLQNRYGEVARLRYLPRRSGTCREPSSWNARYRRHWRGRPGHPGGVPPAGERNGTRLCLVPASTAFVPQMPGFLGGAP